MWGGRWGAGRIRLFSATEMNNPAQTSPAAFLPAPGIPPQASLLPASAPSPCVMLRNLYFPIISTFFLGRPEQELSGSRGY